MPVNPLKDIRRVLRHFNIPVDSSVIVKSSTRTFLVSHPAVVASGRGCALTRTLT